jgi:hypothetical protein
VTAPASRGPEVADIFRAHGAAYRAAHTLTPVQRKAFDAILACRTAVLGGHLDMCRDCGNERPSYNSCRNRHCPKCQCLAQARWIAARSERVLPVPHFHVVFTLPAQLRPLAYRCPVAIFNMLFTAVADTLLALAHDPDRLGGTPGITLVLHTWTRELTFHPHVHGIVTGGGLAPEGDRWIPSRAKHLFPVRVLGALFRGKFLAALTDAHQRGLLDLTGPLAPLADQRGFARLKKVLHRTDWIVYAKRPFGGAKQVFAYLGRYTHRVGLSNQRLRAIDDAVTFVTKGGRTVTLTHAEFIRRFLNHVLPHRFVKIRHLGLLAAANVKRKLVTARALLAEPVAIQAEPVAADPVDAAAVALGLHGWQALIFRITGHDPTRCAQCGGVLVRIDVGPRRGQDSS